MIVSALRSANVNRVHLLGALLADTPHTRPGAGLGCPPAPELMKQLGWPPPAYEGPTGIVGVLADSLQRAGIEV